MTDTKIVVETVEFPLTPWRIEGELDEKIWPVPGTWTLAPSRFITQGIKALISCPRCKLAGLIPGNVGTVTNGVNDLQGYSCQQCGFLCHARLLGWDTRKLYCIAYEIIGADNIPKLEKEYTHAETRNEAFQYFVETGKARAVAAKVRFRVVEVGEVIGYFGKESDKDQKVLTVD